MVPYFFYMKPVQSWMCVRVVEHDLCSLNVVHVCPLHQLNMLGLLTAPLHQASFASHLGAIDCCNALQ